MPHHAMLDVQACCPPQQPTEHVGAQAAMQDTAIDPETGAIDMDIINTGVSASRRLARSDLAKELRELLLRTPWMLAFQAHWAGRLRITYA